jgi:SAM-dependent methyltransferase
MMREWLRRLDSVRGLVNAARAFPGDVRRLRWQSGRDAVIREYLRAPGARKLQIGAGPNELSGWLNADYEPRSSQSVFLDATTPFPIPSDSFDLIFSEHMIEHVRFQDGQKMLAECHRILRSGGKLRLATPNLNRIAALATASPSPEQQRYVTWARANHVEFDGSASDTYRASYVINNFFWGFGHFFVYDPETLTDALLGAGFRDVRFFSVGESDEEGLRGLESHERLIGREFNDFETMVAQATKP